MKYDTLFWGYLEKLIHENGIIIDRPKGTRHPKYNTMVYPADYGYIKNTKSMDNGGIDVFIGSEDTKKVDTIFCILDVLKKDSEIKVLFGCTEEEKINVYAFLNASEYMKAIMVKR